MVNTIINKVKHFGFVPKSIEYDTYYDIIFNCIGFDVFNENKILTEQIKKICGEDLMEFYYGGEVQHIYIRKNIKKERLKKINTICQKSL